MLDYKNVRVPWQGAPYPPYHQGMYMEEYFFDYYIKNKKVFDDTGYTLLPIFWTTAYLYQLDVVSYIKALPKHLKYFCIAQHDDGVKEMLPEETIVFSAGGNSGGIPIPLVCSPIDTHTLNYNRRDILCSFIGSNTHEVRKIMTQSLKDDQLFYIQNGEWSWNLDDVKQDVFLNVTSRSKFTLCPRGYGAQSFRFYEALQLGSVPIYVYDDNKWLPYSNILNWNEFSILIHINDIFSLKEILLSISDKQLNLMRQKGNEVYQNYFALPNLPRLVLEYLKNNAKY